MAQRTARFPEAVARDKRGERGKRAHSGSLHIMLHALAAWKFLQVPGLLCRSADANSAIRKSRSEISQGNSQVAGHTRACQPPGQWSLLVTAPMANAPSAVKSNPWSCRKVDVSESAYFVYRLYLNHQALCPWQNLASSKIARLKLAHPRMPPNRMKSSGNGRR